MEQMNKIEIRGNVGNVNINTVGESRVAHFSVATNLAYKSRNSEPIIETTWHSVTAWQGRNIPNLEIISKGCPIYVLGRVKTHQYTGSDGVERTSYEIIASQVEQVDGNMVTPVNG